MEETRPPHKGIRPDGEFASTDNRHRGFRWGGSAIPKRCQVTGQCSAWLKLEGTRKEGSYRIIPERADIVRRIFDLAVAGYGHRAITDRLNDERVPTHEHLFRRRGSP